MFAFDSLILHFSLDLEIELILDLEELNGLDAGFLSSDSLYGYE